MEPRPELEKLIPCPHGGPDYGELERMGLPPEEILDFSVSTNPFGPPPGMREILLQIPIEKYPDTEATSLRRKLSESLGVDMNEIIIGNGSMEILRLFSLAFLREGVKTLILEPTFGEYEVAAKIMGSRVIKLFSEEEKDFRHNLEEILSIIRRERIDVLFICNPNNPTGQYLKPEEMEKLLKALEGILVVDEAYISFVEKGRSSIELLRKGNILILRSLTKDYSLAGLRLGYGIAPRKLIEPINKVKPPWNVNSIALKAGEIALAGKDFLEESMKKIRESSLFLREGFKKLGLKVIPSHAHFFMVKVGNAKKFREKLLRKRIQVRDCSSFGLPSYIRVSPRTIPEGETLLKAVRETLSENENQ